MRYELSSKDARLFITVEDGVIVQAESPTHGCFNANFVGEPWSKMRGEFEKLGFLITTGS